MAKKNILDEKTREAINMTVAMYFESFNEFMNLTEKNVALSIQLATGLNIAMMQGANEREAKEKIGKIMGLLGDGSSMTS